MPNEHLALEVPVDESLENRINRTAVEVFTGHRVTSELAMMIQEWAKQSAQQQMAVARAKVKAAA